MYLGVVAGADFVLPSSRRIRVHVFDRVRRLSDMDVTRSSLGAGVAATATLLLSLVVLDWVFAGTSPVLFATFTGLCAVGGPPYCELGSPTAALLTYVWFALLFAMAWPLLFGGFTWGLPGESGLLHGLLFGVVLWTGYAVVVV
jgi:hypothetical protein